MTGPPRILFIDDDPDDRALALSLLRSFLPDVSIAEAGDGVAFAEALARGAFDAVVTEHRLSWADGLKVLRAVRGLYPHRPVVLFTAEADPELASKALRFGVDGYVPKTSRGYLRLGALLEELLERPARRAPQAADAPAEAGRVNELAGIAEALRRSNRELEQFAHVVSHDLQEPLQLVVRYARLIGERFEEALGEDGGRFLGHLVESAERMQSMIDSILEYSRLGADGPPAGPAEPPVDLEAVVDEALANLGGAAEAAAAEITRGPLPAVTADRAQMVQLFQNLIGNAIKFRAQGHKPRVHVSATESDGSWVLSVADDGIGIDPAQHERIFRMFQRLHSKGEYPGTGIGLALCQRIVERHGGCLRVESRPGHGATFSAVLPKPAAPPPSEGGG